MTGKSMPERIYVWKSGIQINCSRSYQPGDAEYVRADLIPEQGGANEPLEAGQWRWVKVFGSWNAVCVTGLRTAMGGHVFYLVGRDHAISTSNPKVEVGPIIQSPTYQRN